MRIILGSFVSLDIRIAVVMPSRALIHRFRIGCDLASSNSGLTRATIGEPEHISPSVFLYVCV